MERESIERDILIEGATCGVREKLGTWEVSRKPQDDPAQAPSNSGENA